MHENLPPRILICEPLHDAGLTMLRKFADVEVFDGLNEDQLNQILPQYDGVIVREKTKVSSDLLEHAFRLKIIGRAMPGLENIDVATAKDKGIEVVNAPTANTLAIAEHTLGLLLAMARRILWAETSLRQGTGDRQHLSGMGLAGKTLGIVGFGPVGREIAVRGQAFGMKIIVNQPQLTPELALEANVKTVDLNYLLEESDFVTLHIPSTLETAHIIGAEQLARMKPTAYLINTTHGNLVDEFALVKALDLFQIAGAALDVLTGDETPDHPLVQHPRVIVTPSIASYTEDAAREAAITVAEKFTDFFSSQEVEPILPLLIVPTEKVFPHELFDQKRVARLAQRIQSAGSLKNPPLVMETERGYMVLDGATRSAAMRQMGLPHMLVQVFKADTEGLQLKTWHHVIREIGKSELMELIKSIPDLEFARGHVETVSQEQFDLGSLCYFHWVDGSILLIQAKSGTNRLDALNQLTSAYIDASNTSRTLNKDIIQLQHEYPDMTALVIFPIYSVKQVIQIAQAGRRLPAGITRFIAPGRILRVNFDMEILRDTKTLREKNRWLHEQLLEKQQNGQIRYYAEPLYLLDE
ncbi:MAG: NAD(P)-dependent oxidoreductase [Chloroflexota bacterium]